VHLHSDLPLRFSPLYCGIETLRSPPTSVPY
jgi:hypothetical protein